MSLASINNLQHLYSEICAIITIDVSAGNLDALEVLSILLAAEEHREVFFIH